MPKIPIFAALLIFSFLLVVFTFSYNYISVSDSDNDTTLKNVARNAMTEAVNYGNLRVNEELTINEEVAVEAAVRLYAASSDFEDGGRYLNVAAVSSNPPMIALDSYTEINTPMKNTLNKIRNKTKAIEPNVTRSREVIIYEAKSRTKP